MAWYALDWESHWDALNLIIVMYLKERFHTWNKCHMESEGTRSLASYITKFASSVKSKITELGRSEEFFFSDDCMVIYRNIGFLRDQKFQRALGERARAPLDGRLWRLWTLCWALNTSYEEGTSIFDIGTYNGDAILTAIEYARLKGGLDYNASIYLFDYFENPPNEARKIEHGDSLKKEVAHKFAAYKNARICGGDATKNITGKYTNVSFCQIDLNNAVADTKCFEIIYSKLIDGAIVIFDDYGFSRYKDTQRSLDIFLYSRNPKARILELPTGQGLYIHQGV